MGGGGGIQMCKMGKEEGGERDVQMSRMKSGVGGVYRCVQNKE
jgi:hypothetical protein